MQPFVSPSASIHPSVTLRPGCWIGPNVVIEAGVVIGHYAIIGGPPEHRDFYDDVDGENTKGVIIKEGARIFEFATVHAGTKHPTTIGNNAAVFNKAHVAHDCVLEANVQVGGQCSLAGHVYAQRGANISGKSCLVQFAVVGAYAFVGGFTFVTRHVPPGEKWLGFPAKFVSNNDVGLQRAGLTYEECLKLWKQDYDNLTKWRTL